MIIFLDITLGTKETFQSQNGKHTGRLSCMCFQALEGPLDALSLVSYYSQL